MKNIYIDCSMGAAGDMLLSALCELMEDQEEFIDSLNALNIPHVTYTLNKTKKCGILGSHITVSIHGEVEGEEWHHHHHKGIKDITALISSLPLTQKIKADAIAVYNLIAKAEGQVHGEEMENIHFHEVGTMDAVADVVGVCMAMDKLNPNKITASPVHTGSGTVKCAHGILPVPAPATAIILEGVPIYSDGIRGELCTPTGAALLKYFVKSFGEMPLMKIEKTGYGMGTKDFERANCVRIMLYNEENDSDEITCLSCNIDDMTGEEMGFATEQLLSAGALEVYTTPVYMKKNRNGILLTLLCKTEDRERFVNLIFKYTTTLGIRENTFKRHVLSRREEIQDTKYGQIRKKISEGFGEIKEKYEFDDLREAAIRNETSIIDIKNKLDK